VVQLFSTLAPYPGGCGYKTRVTSRIS